MMEKNINQIMNEFQLLVNSAQPEEATEKLVRFAATMPLDISLEALARLYVVTATRARFDQARLANLTAARDV
jgi:hypothetical protein